MGSVNNRTSTRLLQSIFTSAAASEKIFIALGKTVVVGDATTLTEPGTPGVSYAYARVNADTGSTTWSISGITATNANLIQFNTNTGTNWGGIRGMAMINTSTLNQLNTGYICHDDFTTVTVNVNDRAQFAAGTGITVTID